MKIGQLKTELCGDKYLRTTVMTKNPTILMKALGTLGMPSSPHVEPKTGTDRLRKRYNHNHRKPQVKKEGIFVRWERFNEQVIGYRLLSFEGEVQLFSFVIAWR